MTGRKVSRLLSLGLLSWFLSGGYLPPWKDKDSEETTKASGTRGCPVPLGELYLVGQQLKTQKSRPTLLFWVNPASPAETLLVVVRKPDFPPLFEKRIEVRERGYYPITIQAELEPAQSYGVTAGLLCQERTNNAVVLETSLTRVGTATALDRRVEEILGMMRADKPKEVPLAPEIP